MSEERIFRVTVRGRFFGLSEASRASLKAAQDEHDVSRAAFTHEGTLTYDAKIDFFSFRYEMRPRGERADEMAAQLALGEVEQFMNTMGFGYRGLKVTATDMAAVWSPRKRVALADRSDSLPIASTPRTR